MYDIFYKIIFKYKVIIIIKKKSNHYSYFLDYIELLLLKIMTRAVFRKIKR